MLICSTNGVDLVQDGHDTLGDLSIEAMAGRQDDRLRTELERLRHRHGRATAEGAGRVRRRRHHPALLRPAAYQHRLAGQLRVFKYFNRREKGVEVEVEDYAYRHNLISIGPVFRNRSNLHRN